MPAGILQEVASGVFLGAVAFAGMLVVMTLLQTIGYVAQDMSLPRAVGRATGNTWGALAALGTGTVFVVTQGIDIAGLFANTVATAPLAASQIVTMVLGVLGMQGYLTDMAFLIGAASFAVFTITMREVRG